MMKRIESVEDIARGSAWLAQREKSFAKALALTGPPPLRRNNDGFAALLHAIVGQQISIAAGAAIWKRLQAAKLTGPRKVAAATDAELQACGLSRPKVRYARALTAARINYKSLREISTEEVIAILVEVPGIGRWTAEIYTLFALGHADAFASGDLALQESARMLFDLEERPGEKELRNLAEDWAPWRGVAARILWSYYAYRKKNPY